MRGEEVVSDWVLGGTRREDSGMPQYWVLVVVVEVRQ